MLQISRKLHCALAGMNGESVKTLQRYGRLPVLPPEFRPDKPYGPFETFVLATYNALVQYNDVSRERAASICSAGAAILAARWVELAETAAQRRSAKKGEIFFGRVDLAGMPKQGGGPRAVVGTLQEIATEIAAAQDTTDLGAFASTTISVTHVAELVRNRAARHGIDIKQFWAEPFSAVAAKSPRARMKGAVR